MAVITLVCGQCGGQVGLDDTREFGFCNHCGTKILIKQDIIHNTTNYNTQHTTNQVINKTIIGKEQNEAEDYIRNGNVFLSLGEDFSADKAFKEAIKLNPADYRGWLGLCLMREKGFGLYCQDYFHSVHSDTYLSEAEVDARNKESIEKKADSYFEKAIAVANDEQKAEIYAKAPATTARYKRKKAEQEKLHEEKQREEKAEQEKLHEEKQREEKFATLFEFKELNIGTTVLSIEKYTGTECCVTIPEKIGTKTVTIIGRKAFESSRDTIISVFIPENIRYVGDFAFQDCVKITSILLLDSISAVGAGAFLNWGKHQKIYVNKANSKKWDKNWDKNCKAKIFYR